MTTQAFRVEEDTLGIRSIPVDALYGSQTDRAVENFQISGRTLTEWPLFIAAFAFVKEACAFANFSLGKLPEQKYKAIALACAEVRSGIHNRSLPSTFFKEELEHLQI